MKIPDLSRYALGIFASITILAGCNTAGSKLTPSSPTLQNVVRSGLNINASSKPDTSPLSGDVLTANKVSVRITSCKKTGPVWGYSAKFTASGEAKGPYPGALSVRGNWHENVGIGRASWGFYEKFAITSGKSTISGVIELIQGKTPTPDIDCATFGPETSEGFLTYRSGSWSGSVTIPYKIREGHLGKEQLH